MIRTEYLSASAGSGKTFALSKRFCELLMHNVSPEAIVALTFTRAATREIFSSIIERLVKDDVADLEGTTLSRDDALARLLEALPRVQISTIDSFTSRIARLYAFELGLDAEFSLYDGADSAEAKDLRREACAKALRCATLAEANALLKRFMFCLEGKTKRTALGEALQQYLKDLGTFFQDHPKGWGNLEALEVDPTVHRTKERAECLAVLQAVLEDNARWMEKDEAKEKFRTVLAHYYAEEGSVFEIKRRWKRADESSDTFFSFFIRMCDGVFSFKRAKVPLSAEETQAAQALYEDLISRDLEQTAWHTEQLGGALAEMAKAYQAVASQAGLVSFDELTRTLGKTLGGKLAFVDPKALAIAYRLDCAVDHLMIDEFQDTSTTQWKVLESFAKELSDLAERPEKTFFYVGDIKQSIYGWRGGESSLFNAVGIPCGKDLLESYRSSPAIIDFINRAMVFSEEEISLAEPHQQEVLRAWQDPEMGWKSHEAHRKDKGYVAWVTCKKMKGEGDTHQVVADCIAERYRTLAGRGLSFAVLARTNGSITGKAKSGTDEDATVGLLSLLRDRKIPCALNGKRGVGETPIGQLVIHLLRWMIDPRPTLWPEVARQMGLSEASDSALLTEWAKMVEQEGFGGWLEHCLVAPLHPLTAADEEVLGVIRLEMSRWDAQGEKDPQVVLNALEALSMSCAADKQVVNLMTIHASKGLTYDVVFTLLEGKIENPDNESCEFGEDWVFEKPVMGDETYATSVPLQDSKTRRKISSFKDALCTTYVGLTRARREQWIFNLDLMKKGEPSKPKLEEMLKDARKGNKLKTKLFVTFPELIAPHLVSSETIPLPNPLKTNFAVCRYANGDSDWWEEVPLVKAKATKTEQPAPFKSTTAASDFLQTEQPSEAGYAVRLEELLQEGFDTARKHGISVHAELAQVDWSEEPPRGLFKEVFTKPAEPCELWRERSFCVLVDGHRMAGQFDRVHLYPESQRAEIYDFKTSREAVVTPGYARQLNAYRRALAALTGYDPARIDCYLLFTRTGTTCEVPHD